jgi:hypothetical protein
MPFLGSIGQGGQRLPTQDKGVLFIWAFGLPKFKALINTQ